MRPGAIPAPAEDRGLYIVWFELPSLVRARIGSLGEGAFPPGLYAYVGSAQVRRTARIRRHLRREKPRRWHIDYLLPQGRPVAVTLCPGARDQECRLAEQVLAVTLGRRAHPRFGASDCRCGGHLVAAAARDFGPIAAQIDRVTGGATAPAELWRS